AVSFTPGSTVTTVVIGGAASAGPPTERYETDVLDIGSRMLRPFGPAGLRPADGPWNWLPDGSLLAYRPARASGGDPGVYVVAPATISTTRSTISDCITASILIRGRSEMFTLVPR